MMDLLSSTSPPEARRASSASPPRVVTSGDVRLAVYSWGAVSRDGERRPTVVLVHGYPDNASVFRPIAEALADRFHVVAYDVRGAGRSSAPESTSDYSFDRLVRDLSNVLDAVSPDAPVHLVGYDWGALQGWEALLGGALEHRIASFTTAAPSLEHVANWVVGRLRRRSPRALAEVVGLVVRDVHMLLVQLPVVPELAWRAGLSRFWPTILRAIADVRVEATETQQADAVNGLALYRANLPVVRPGRRTTRVPVQLLVMTNDEFVPSAIYEGIEAAAPHLRMRSIAAGHWGVLTHATEIADHVATFIHSVEST